MTDSIDQQTGNGWTLVNGDCVEVVRAMPDSSVDLSVFSPPFASLYTYSNSDRDMGNCKTHGEFHEHFRFLLADMLRVTKMGRNMSVHCMDLPSPVVLQATAVRSDAKVEIQQDALRRHRIVAPPRPRMVQVPNLPIDGKGASIFPTGHMVDVQRLATAHRMI